MPQERGQRRKHSRSLSPVPNKRSWQNDGATNLGVDARRAQRPRSPQRRDRKHFKSPPKFHDRKDYRPSSSGDYKSRLSPHNLKRARSPFTGQGQAPTYSRNNSLPHARDHSHKDHRSNNRDERSHSRLPPRPSSPRPVSKPSNNRDKHNDQFPKSTQGSDIGDKKKHRTSSSPPPKRNRSATPIGAQVLKKAETSTQQKISTERKVSSSGKKKTSRITLHKRFTLEDQEPFELEENVTIAILRNPNAEPSEDVTVKKVFDASLFKMVHKKNEGKKPIFDREEIKVWRHDENLTDDPDFERRLVRVKSTSSGAKAASDSLSRMSPDVIRKAFGLHIGVSSGSKSPHRNREPQIRLDPKPDPRYESKFKEQLEREEMRNRKRGDDKFGASEKRGNKMEMFDRRSDRGIEETYDLRHALERRRSDRGEGSGFRIEVQHGDTEPGTELYYREDNSRQFAPSSGSRNVVFDQEKDTRRFSSIDRESSWDNDRRTVRRRGRGGMGRGRRRAWSPERDVLDGDMRRNEMRERRPRYSVSPSRAWRGGFRGRGRGRGREFLPVDQDVISPSNIDDSFKYTQHDDRDLSPKPFRGRGRGRFPSRNFGSSNFRMINRGGFRGNGGGRGFRGGYKGGFGPDRRSVERRPTSLDREWKHDMYDSLQTEEEQPHSTTLVN
ncbi:serine/arginine repetitive matrix protein 1 [Biomphalaria glabrata]|nr:serine/arginine repetitive matrix protein 1 [Biomphalaria glabrata]